MNFKKSYYLKCTLSLWKILHKSTTGGVWILNEVGQMLEAMETVRIMTSGFHQSPTSTVFSSKFYIVHIHAFICYNFEKIIPFLK